MSGTSHEARSAFILCFADLDNSSNSSTGENRDWTWTHVKTESHSQSRFRRRDWRWIPDSPQPATHDTCQNPRTTAALVVSAIRYPRPIHIPLCGHWNRTTLVARGRIPQSQTHAFVVIRETSYICRTPGSCCVSKREPRNTSLHNGVRRLRLPPLLNA